MTKAQEFLAGRGEQILAVDDSPATLRVIAHLVGEAGYRVRTARGGAEALAFAAQAPPDLVLLDIHMPGLDGYQVCRALHAAPATAEVPVIFITGAVEPEARVAGFEAGAVDHVGKPFEQAELLARIGVQLALRRARLEAEQRAAALARSNEELARFAYVVSHDLQEPLRMMGAYAALLGKRYRGRLDADADEFIGYMVDGAARMKALIDEILAFSRVGTRGLRLAACQAVELVEAARANLELRLQEAGAELRCGPLPEVRCDRTQLTQLFQNLIGNAVKFRGEAPPVVEVTAARGQGGWTFAVKDNGIGIPAGELERVFEVFQRVQGREGYPGHGVGLAVCKKVVERHGGTIRAESAPGQGTTVYFSLPEAPPSEPGG